MIQSRFRPYCTLCTLPKGTRSLPGRSSYIIKSIQFPLLNVQLVGNDGENRWLSVFVRKSQISKYSGSFRNRKSRKFLKCASPQIEKSQISLVSQSAQIANPQICKEKSGVSDPHPNCFTSNTFFAKVSIF